MATPQQTRTVILGGGFGGIAAANTLRPLLGPGHLVTVVDRSRRFHVGAGKTWLMLGARRLEEFSRDRAELLARGVDFLPADVLGIDVAGATVETSAGRLPWDHLVIALGADVNLGAVPGLAEAAQTFYTPAGAERLRETLAGFDRGEIALVIPRTPFKCPPAPYEAALLLHHFLESQGRRQAVKLDLYTVEGAPMATAGPEMGRFISGELAQRGIGYHPKRKLVRAEAGGRMFFEDGSEAKCDLLIAVPPHEAPAVVRAAGLTNPSGWIPVDPKTLRATGLAADRSVFAIGDVSVVTLPGRYAPDTPPLVLPKAGVFAEAQGRLVGRRIAALAGAAVATPEFDAVGFCYLEVGGGRAVRAEGSFFALPHPQMRKHTPDAEQFRDKLAWVAQHLQPPT